MNPPTVAIIVVAAGSGARLGGPEPKAFVTVNGVSILASALDTVFSLAEPAQVIVVAPAGKLDTADRIGRDAAGAASEYLSVVSGGATRQQSVAAGLAVLGDSVTTVLVHDAARSLTPSSLFDAVIAAVRDTGSGVVPGIAVADTIKQTDDAGTVLRTLDRSTLVAVQTPQGFPRAQLVDAYAAADREFTDDAA
ncbi:MAG: 2-C-methyl-D-erythritol 4-phosphate cytidylyltransferase, partial [Microbacteriaceae bacterium]|nr:2-C-methyl-D-erythritol 4-phosphate cytidylyltransferase [Microbacteriaceae bacterium]